jgi:predicted hydrolase (HD superfamily)
MTGTKYTRTEAWTLLNQYTQSAGLIKHALAVEACMSAHGEQQATTLGLSGDAAGSMRDTYRITGLLHDFDYEKYPSAEEHPFVGNKILAEQGWPEEIREAIMGHAQYSGVARKTHLAKALFACDELAGFLTAVSLVKPTRSIFTVDVASVRKKIRHLRAVYTAKTSPRGRRNWGSNSTPILLSASPPCAAPPGCWAWKA